MGAGARNSEEVLDDSRAEGQDVSTANQINAKALRRPDPGCSPYETLVKVHVLLAKQADPTDGALFYHAIYVTPYWADPRHKSVSIRGHIFYRAAKVRGA